MFKKASSVGLSALAAISSPQQGACFRMVGLSSAPFRCSHKPSIEALLKMSKKSRIRDSGNYKLFTDSLLKMLKLNL